MQPLIFGLSLGLLFATSSQVFLPCVNTAFVFRRVGQPERTKGDECRLTDGRALANRTINNAHSYGAPTHQDEPSV